ncbi:MAG: ATP-binding protein [Polyangia bacterium]|jgi:PAS domain S-box-containing protein
MVADLVDPHNSQNDVDVIGLIADFDRHTSHLSFAEIAKGALAFMADRLHIGRASIALLRPEGDGFRVYDATVDVQGVESGTIVPHGSGTLSETVDQKRAIYRADIRDWPAKNALDQAFISHGFLSTISVPLMSGGRCKGTLNAAASRVDGIDLATRQVIELVAPRLTYAFEMGIALDALAESEARFRDVFDTVGDGIVVADVSNRKIVMVNAPMCALLGRSSAELLKLTINNIHPSDRIDFVIATFEAMVRGEHDHAMEIPMLRADGTVFLADVSARRTVIDNKRCVVAVFRDSTTRRRREEEQVHVQKLESIRTLAAGIAHDFNNLLTSLIGNVSLAQMSLAQSHEARGMLDEAQRAATRATALTRQLLTFAKGGAPLRRRTSIVKVLRDAANLATSGTSVRCLFDLPDENLAVMGDEGQLAQVFQNLVRNAADAMPGGGVVRVHLSRQAGGEGGEICIKVTDHGPGIAPDVLDKIFLPFFTTKERGSGLGLAVAYSIIQQHGGRIDATSAVDAGTTFRVILPLLGSSDATPTPTLVKYRVAGRVLVMDDESSVLRLVQRALQDAGYATKAATNGGDAVEFYRQALADGQCFDAVVLDLTVRGGMGGREAAERILAIDPSARLLVSSGYSDDAVMADYRRHGFAAALPKPYTAQQLADAVQEIIGEAGQKPR